LLDIQTILSRLICPFFSGSLRVPAPPRETKPLSLSQIKKKYGPLWMKLPLLSIKKLEGSQRAQLKWMNGKVKQAVGTGKTVGVFWGL
jgi:hypothetical protein